MTNVSVIYYSSTGTVDAMARRAAQTAEKLGADVRLRHVAETAPDDAVAENDDWVAHREAVADQPEAELDDLEWADVVLFGSPTRYGSIASQLQAFLDTTASLWEKGALADKVYAGFTASQTEHGGQETTLVSLYTTIYHWGGIVVAPGYTDKVKFADGNPYGAAKVTGETADLEQPDLDAIDHLVERVVRVSGKLTG
jgi:NAD(P)H dehydrogenase (quinone)